MRSEHICELKVGHTNIRNHISEITDTLPNIDITKAEDSQECYRMASAANGLAPCGDQWQASINRAGSEWKQGRIQPVNATPNVSARFSAAVINCNVLRGLSFKRLAIPFNSACE